MKRKRCALCRCTSVATLHGFAVCGYHFRHSEDDPPCPICATLGNPKWTFTTTGELTPRKVEVRQVKLSKTVFLDDVGELVLAVECVTEVAPAEWPTKKRPTVIMVGIGQQVGQHFYITQYASDWERDLMEAVRPSLALAPKIYIEGRDDYESLVMAGQWVSARELPWNDTALWPSVDIRTKVLNVRTVFAKQDIEPQIERLDDIRTKDVMRYWDPFVPQATARDAATRLRRDRRQKVWRHNYLAVLDTCMKIFQIEWGV